LFDSMLSQQFQPNCKAIARVSTGHIRWSKHNMSVSTYACDNHSYNDQPNDDQGLIPITLRRLITTEIFRLSQTDSSSHLLYTKVIQMLSQHTKEVGYYAAPIV
jgi:hypothetical protein